VDHDILKGLRETGCFRIWYGAESGSQKVLDSMTKGTTVQQVREAARITQEVGMQAGFFILLGYPDETTADIRMTIDFLKDTRPDVVGTSIAFPIKGTEFYHRVEKRIMPDENWSSRNQNKLLFKGKYPRLYYWFAVRWLVKEVNVDKIVAPEESTVFPDPAREGKGVRRAARRGRGRCRVVLSLAGMRCRHFVKRWRN
jgi:radical SAM superfamily enzyme YgiQ (UPF0313 family)